MLGYTRARLEGGYLPVQAFFDAVLGTGFTGWLSIEVFDSKAKDKFNSLGHYAKKGMESLQQLLE